MSRETGVGGRGVAWAAGLVVALGAGVATAHGLYQVATASHVPAPVAWLYPLITDGLALVAYAATTRLTDAGRRYAWAVVVLAAGLSGLAQAAYLAGAVASAAAGAVDAAPTLLRFGVGAWPAIAAAIVAHLVYLLGSQHGTNVPATGVQPAHPTATDRDAHALNCVVRPEAGALAELSRAAPYGALSGRPAEPSDALVQQHSDVYGQLSVPADRNGAGGTGPLASRDAESTHKVQTGVQSNGHADSTGTERPAVQPVQPTETPASDRARAAAKSHLSDSGDLPTVTELMQLAQVARGTAGAVLKELRAQQAAAQIDHRTSHTVLDPPTEGPKSQPQQQNHRPANE